MNLRTIAETTTTITVGWDPVAGQEGYVPLVDGSELLVDGKRHASTSKTATSCRIGKPQDGKPHTYELRILGAVASGSLVSPAPPPPPTTVSGGVGLYQMGGTLASTSHLDDGTYALVVGDWADGPLLASKPIPETYVYTVTTSGVTPGTESWFVILDANPNGGTIPNALPPKVYAQRCIDYVKANPGLDGIFLDNCLGTIPGILAAMQTVSAMFKQAGVKWGANVGGYVSGDSGSDDGSLWRKWATQLDPVLDRMMLENWQEMPSQSADAATPPPTGLRKSGQEYYNHWDEWQLCPGAVPGKFLGITYNYGDPNWANYGRASMLLAPNAHPGNVYATSLARAGDPYGPWATKTPHPTIDAAHGTATL